MNTITRYWTGYKAMTATGLINRILTATGSPSIAQANEFANFNGHRVTVYFNERRKYWLAEYFWAGRRVLNRGSFEDCVTSALSFHKGNGMGGSVIVDCPSDKSAYLESLGLAEWSDEIEKQNYDSLLDPTVRDEAINTAYSFRNYRF